MQDVKQIYDSFSQRMIRNWLMKGHFFKCIIRDHIYNHNKIRNTFLRMKQKSVLIFHKNMR